MTRSASRVARITASRIPLRAPTIAPVLALLLAFGPSARAEDVVTRAHARVTSISVDTPATGNQLAALGVALEADVLVEFVIDSEAPLGTSVNPNYTYFTPAVSAASVSIADYRATFSPPQGLALLNSVQVGNDVPIAPSFVADSYFVHAVGSDTDSILEGHGAGATVGCVFNFSDGSGATLSDDGVIQDVSGFQLGLGNVTGPLGNISFLFDLATVEFDVEGDGGGGGATALARKGQLKAAAQFARRVLSNEARFAKAPPGVDTQGLQQAALLDKASESFGVQFVKAVNKALGKGGSSPLPASAKDDVVSSLRADLLVVSAALQTGTDVDDKHDRALRGKLLKAAARLTAAEFAAHSQHAAKPVRNKLLDKLASARGKLIAQVDKALAAAAKHAVVYSGPAGDELADDLETLVDAFVLLTTDG